jgi:hypothetical protein
MAIDPEQYLTKCRQLIAEYGWMVQGVMPDDDNPNMFYYTAGLTAHGLPEIVGTLALDYQMATPIMNAVARKFVERGTAFENFSLLHEIIVNAPVMIRNIANTGDVVHLSIAEHLYGPRIRAVHLIFPDAAGLFPGEAGHRMADQMWPNFVYEAVRLDS